MEGKLATRTIARLADRDSLDEKDRRLLLKGIGLFEKTFDGLGFCLSEKCDLLSQWRGYAEDGTGVAIGFSVEYLKWLSSANPAYTLGVRRIGIESPPTLAPSFATLLQYASM